MGRTPEWLCDVQKKNIDSKLLEHRVEYLIPFLYDQFSKRAYIDRYSDLVSLSRDERIFDLFLQGADQDVFIQLSTKGAPNHPKAFGINVFANIDGEMQRAIGIHIGANTDRDGGDWMTLGVSKVLLSSYTEEQFTNMVKLIKGATPIEDKTFSAAIGNKIVSIF